MSQTRVVILNEVSIEMDKNWKLCLQLCRYEYGKDGGEQSGYRFIWRRDNGHLQAARGQARIPSLSIALKLIAMAIEDGWGDKIYDEFNFEYK